jgi:hypothetical protein
VLTRRELLWFAAAFLLVLPLVTTRLYASDEIEHYAWLRSLAFDADVNFENEYQYFYDAGVSRTPDFHETFLERTTEIGLRVNYAAPGSALLWAPFFGVAHLVALATGQPADGFSQPYISGVAYASAFYAFLAIAISAAIARRLVGRGIAAGLAIAAGTPLLFYAIVAPAFGHAASAFAVSLFIWIWLRVRESWTWQGVALLGLSAGLMGIVREQDLLLAAAPAIDFIRSALLAARSSGTNTQRRSLVQRTAIAGVGTVSFLIAYAPLLLAYTALNGRPAATETATRKMSWSSPHAFSVLFDPEHGFLAWTPLAILAIAGLVLLAVRGAPGARATGERAQPDLKWIGWMLLLMVLIQTYSSGSVESWTVAGSFGQRRFVALTPILVVGLAALLAHVRIGWPKHMVRILVFVCIWWNLGLMAQFGLHLMDRQRLTLSRNARLTFVELPLQAPSIAWRYLTDRSSLYKIPKQ